MQTNLVRVSGVAVGHHFTFQVPERGGPIPAPADQVATIPGQYTVVDRPAVVVVESRVRSLLDRRIMVQVAFVLAAHDVPELEITVQARGKADAVTQDLVRQGSILLELVAVPVYIISS